jgi:hypothetical protein
METKQIKKNKSYIRKMKIAKIKIDIFKKEDQSVCYDMNIINFKSKNEQNQKNDLNFVLLENLQTMNEKEKDASKIKKSNKNEFGKFNGHYLNAKVNCINSNKTIHKRKSFSNLRKRNSFANSNHNIKKFEYPSLYNDGHLEQIKKIESNKIFNSYFPNKNLDIPIKIKNLNLDGLSRGKTITKI